MSQKLLSVDEVAAKLGVCRASVYNLSKNSAITGFPLQYKLGKTARWGQDDVDQWLAECAPRGAHGQGAVK